MVEDPKLRQGKASQHQYRTDQLQQLADYFCHHELEHGVRIGEGVRDLLEDVPVLDDPPLVVKAKDIDTGPVALTRPHLLAVQNK